MAFIFESPTTTVPANLLQTSLNVVVPALTTNPRVLAKGTKVIAPPTVLSPARKRWLASSVVPVVILQRPVSIPALLKRKYPLAFTITLPAAGAEILVDLTVVSVAPKGKF